MKVNAFAKINSDIRYSKISDGAKVVYAEIYALNYTNVFDISNNLIGENLGKSSITVSRAISELIKGGYVKSYGYGSSRRLEVVIDKKNEYKGLGEESIALRTFYRNLGFDDV